MLVDYALTFENQPEQVQTFIAWRKPGGAYLVHAVSAEIPQQERPHHRHTFSAGSAQTGIPFDASVMTLMQHLALSSDAGSVLAIRRTFQLTIEPLGCRLPLFQTGHSGAGIDHQQIASLTTGWYSSTSAWLIK